MRVPALVVNRHSHAHLHRDGRPLLPLDRVRPFLVTQAFTGVTGLDVTAWPDTSVVDMHRDGEVEALCRWLIRQHGIERITALHEKAVLPVALLRQEFGLQGTQPDVAERFRDKAVMKHAVSQAGIRVPRFRCVDRPADLRPAGWETGPLVLKSRFGAGADDVTVVASLHEAERRWLGRGAPPGRYEIEELVVGTMFHADALVVGGKAVLQSCTEYLDPLMDFAVDGYVAGLMHTGGALHDRIQTLHQEVITALGLVDGVTHLELWHTPDDDLVFCEIACRPGGGLIVEMIEHVFGVNLNAAQLALDCGLEPPAAAGSGPLDTATWGHLGCYPTTGRGVVPEHLFDELGIVEHHHNPFGGIVGGVPRHATDFVDQYLLRHPDPHSFRAAQAELRRVHGS